MIVSKILPMALIKLLLAVVLLVCASAFPSSGKSDDVSDTIKSILSNGYPAEAHEITTSDGYILALHRIPHGKGQSPSGDRPVVFLMHGLLAASNCYTHLGPELAQAYNFADAGFDVWMGNARGNSESRKHVTLNPDDENDRKVFFDFSFEEIALIDLPAMIDYALEYTGKEKLHYIGHSQGGTVFLILCSMKPEYNDKMASVNLMAGVGYQNHFPTPSLLNVASYSDIIYNAAKLTGLVELFPPNSDSDTTTDIANLCAGSTALTIVCNALNVDDLTGLLNEEDLKGLEPSGAAFKQVAHYGQNLRDSDFRRWNFGVLDNLRQYGSISPPRYNLGLVTADVTMYYSVSDILLGEQDVLDMAADMPNTKVRKVARDSFLHVDFLVGSDLKELVTDYILNDLKSYESM